MRGPFVENLSDAAAWNECWNTARSSFSLFTMNFVGSVNRSRIHEAVDHMMSGDRHVTERERGVLT